MRPTALFAVALALAAIGLSAAALAYLFVPVRNGVPDPGVAPFEALFAGAFLFTAPVLGAIVAIRRPGNPTGWLFLSFVLWMALGFATDGYVRHSPPDALAGWAAAIQGLEGFGFGSLFLLLMLFPTGRLPSVRWLPLPVLALVGTAANTFSASFRPGGTFIPPVPGVVNPLGRPDWLPLLGAADTVSNVVFIVVVVGALALLVVRFHRSRGVERQQLKWFVWGAALATICLVLSATAGIVSATLADVAWAFALSSLSLLPLSATIAILRYRLFDIDLIIRRTAVYAALSAVLLALYAGSVLVLQQALAPITTTNSLAVAASTLLVAALFQPARRRIQAIVDRRFYRRRYSAAREIARFGASLRDEVDMERLVGLLESTVERTVQPASAAVWLRGSER